MKEDIETGIRMISIDKLHPHPNNPRKDLGDLSELAESIKQSGIFQNLTAVPAELGYIVIIGHRRLAAAKLAGLKEVPCAIVEMDEKTQIATMLLENMQRSDLTVYEQAEGFQMMMDLGETLRDISEKTGFSESTVRRRAKLLELDKKKFKESTERGATLMDYAELEKIKDIDRRNKVLETIGTPNFRYSLQQAIDTEKREEFCARAIAFLDTFATRIDDSKKDITSAGSIWKDEDLVKPDDADAENYYYKVNGTYIYLYKDWKPQTTQAAKINLEERKQQERYDALNAICVQARKLRLLFADEITQSQAKKNITTLIEGALFAMTRCNTWIKDLINILGREEEELGFFDLLEDIREQPELTLFKFIYEAIDSDYYSCHNYQSNYMKDERINYVYEFLESFGYEMSDEEKAYCDGTHELFKEET